MTERYNRKYGRDYVIRIRTSSEEQTILLKKKLYELKIRDYNDVKKENDFRDFCINFTDKEWIICKSGFDNCNNKEVSFEKFMSREFQSKLNKIMILQALE